MKAFLTLTGVGLAALILGATPAAADCTTQASAGYAQLKLVGAGCITTNGTTQTTPAGTVVLVDGLEFHPSPGVSLALDSAKGTLSSGGGQVTIDVGVASLHQTQLSLQPHAINWRVQANPGEATIGEGSFQGAGAAHLLSLPVLSGIEIKLANGKSDTNFTVQVPLGIPQFNGVRATTTVISDNAAGALFDGLDASIKLFNVPGAGDKLQAPFTSLNGHLTFRLSTKTWNVSLSFSVPGVGSVAGKTQIDDGKVSEIAVSGTYDNPGIALGDSGAFLQSISARFAHYPHYSRPKIGVTQAAPIPASCAGGGAGRIECDLARAEAVGRDTQCKNYNDYYDQWIALNKPFPDYCGKVGEISFDPPVEVDGSVGIAAGPVLAGTAALIATGTLRYVDSYFDGSNKVPWAFDVEGSLALGGLPFDKKTLDPQPSESKFSKFHPINHSGLKAWASVYGDGKVQAGGGFDYKLPRSTDNWLLSITGSAAVSLLPKGAAIGRPADGATPEQYASVVQGDVKNWTIAGTITGQICAQIPTVVKGCATGAAGISNNGVAGCASFDLPGSTVLQSIAVNGAKAINAVARFGRDAGEKLKAVFNVLEQKAKEAGNGAKQFFDKVGTGVVNIVNTVGNGLTSAGETIASWFHFAHDPSATGAANEVVNENIHIPNVNFAIGAVYRWSDQSTLPITSCSHDQLLLALSSRDLARAAAAGVGSAQVTTHGERPAPRIFVLKGVRAAPDVLVMGPDDRAIRTFGPGFAEPGWIVYKDPAIRTTYVDVVDAPPGHWDFVAAPGTSRIASIQTASGESIPTVKAGITHVRNRRFVIGYRIQGEPRGDKVRLAETDGSGAVRTFATLRRRKGTVTYAPAPTLPSSRRVVLALVTRGSVNVSSQPVTGVNLSALAKRRR